jgi:ubiquinone/menaquinone biosynthesis C-methylase UbiE
MIDRVCRIDPGSIRELKVNAAYGSLRRLLSRIGSDRRDRDPSEREYSQAAGYTIAKLHGNEINQYSWIENELRYVSIRTAAKAHYAQRNELLANLSFETVLEVGAGELTSLFEIYRAFGSGKEYLGLDISLNRLLHGRRFLRSHDIEATVCQADGSMIPFPDNSFDLVYSSHSLEQMPTIFRNAISEMIRVSRRYVALFEPAYEHSTLLQKLHLWSADFVREIEPFLRTLDGVRVHPPVLMRNTINPFNRTTLFLLEKPAPQTTAEPRFVCPVSRGALQQLPDGYYSAEAGLFYPVSRGVPVLYAKYAQVVSPELARGE